jgi:outer membrane lipoprotein-sorting protein
VFSLGIGLALASVTTGGLAQGAQPAPKTPAGVKSGESPTEWIRRSEKLIRGDSLKATVTMRIKRDGGERTLKFKLWTLGRDKTSLKILEPVKERNVGNLRDGLKLWQYLPNVDQIITVPPSMMLQSWMGSDFTNDDLVRTSSLTEDYTHELAAKEKVGAFDSYKIICMPKPGASVVWGKVVVWVRIPDAALLKQEFYSEKGELLKVLTGDKIKAFGKHIVPTVVSMKTLKKDGLTVMEYQDVVYDSKMDDQVFRQQFLRKPAD